MAREINGGAMSSKERFERIEATLQRIESGTSPLGKLLIDEHRETRRQVDDLQLHGSRHAQELHEYFERVNRRVDELERMHHETLGAQHERLSRSQRSVRFWEAVAALAITLSAVATILTLVHP